MYMHLPLPPPPPQEVTIATNSPFISQTLHYHRLVGGCVLELSSSLSHTLDLTQHGHCDSSSAVVRRTLCTILQLALTYIPYIH